MYRVTLEINSLIYEHIMFFLENLPKNLLNIQQETKNKNNLMIKNSSIYKLKKLQGVGKELYSGRGGSGHIFQVKLFFCPTRTKVPCHE